MAARASFAKSFAARACPHRLFARRIWRGSACLEPGLPGAAPAGQARSNNPSGKLSLLGCRGDEIRSIASFSRSAVCGGGAGTLVFQRFSGSEALFRTHLRPPGDIDICAPPGRYDETRDLLRRYSILRLSSPGTGLSQETGQFAVNFDPGARIVDLHSSLDRFGLPSLEAVFARSEVIKLGETSIRVPAAEDHFRLVAIHLLSHGAWRPLWLCDIAAMLEDLPQDFNWGRCLGDEPRIARWISSVIELAHRLLGACADRVPPSSRIQRLPKWFTRTVLNEWQTPVAARYGGTSLAFALAHPQRLVDPRKLVVEIKSRWPNGIQATFETGGHLNDVTRLPYQVLAFGQARIQGVALRSRLRAS